MISIAALIVVLAIVAIAMIYNRLVRDRNRVDAAWSDIDVQLQRRHDLVPQLVTAVDQYAGYEKATLEAVTALRAEAVQLTRTNKLDELGRTEQKLDDGIQRLIAVAEEYPDLKANENFLNLQEELAETENYLQFARRFYNGSVREVNTRRPRTRRPTCRWSTWGRSSESILACLCSAAVGYGNGRRAYSLVSQRYPGSQ